LGNFSEFFVNVIFLFSLNFPLLLGGGELFLPQNKFGKTFSKIHRVRKNSGMGTGTDPEN
jgi:hypothetical protein